MNKIFRQVKLVLKETFAHWRAQNPARMGSSISFFAIFSMAPLFVILISIASIIFSHELAQARLIDEIAAFLGNDIARYVSNLIERSATSEGRSWISAIVGFGILLFGALGVFRELSYSLDKLWATDENQKPKRSKPLKQIFAYAKKHVHILFLVGLLSVLFLVSILFSISLRLLGTYLESLWPEGYSLIIFFQPLISFVFVAFFFGVIYRVLPKTKLPLSEIAFGASVTALAFLIGEMLIGFYLSNFTNRSVYGAAGSLISLMIWIYLSAQIFFLAASFTFTYSRRYGHLKKLT